MVRLVAMRWACQRLPCFAAPTAPVVRHNATMLLCSVHSDVELLIFGLKSQFARIHMINLVNFNRERHGSAAQWLLMTASASSAFFRQGRKLPCKLPSNSLNMLVYIVIIFIYCLLASLAFSTGGLFHM
jgi:hypothetical protein